MSRFTESDISGKNWEHQNKLVTSSGCIYAAMYKFSPIRKLIMNSLQMAQL